jgi:hypothetical protein
MKHSKYASETFAKTPENDLKTIANYATSRSNTCNRCMKQLKHTLATCMYMQRLDENTCNIRLILMKHLEHMLDMWEHQS